MGANSAQPALVTITHDCNSTLALACWVVVLRRYCEKSGELAAYGGIYKAMN